MADLETHMEQEHPELSTDSRRALLKKLGLGVGAAWVAPTVLSSAASAQGSPDPDTVCPICGTLTSNAESGTSEGWFPPPVLFPPGILANTPYGAPYPANAGGGANFFKLDSNPANDTAPIPGGSVIQLVAGDAKFPRCWGRSWSMTADTAAWPINVGTAPGPLPPPFPPPVAPPLQGMFMGFIDAGLNPVGFDLRPAAGLDAPGTGANWKTQTMSGTIPVNTAIVAWGFWVLVPSAGVPGVGPISTLFDNVSVTFC